MPHSRYLLNWAPWACPLFPNFSNTSYEAYNYTVKVSGQSILEWPSWGTMATYNYFHTFTPEYSMTMSIL